MYVADVVALALQADLVEVGPRCTLHGVRRVVYVAWCTLHGVRCMVHVAWCMLASLVWQHTAELQLIKSHSAALRAAVTELVAQAAPSHPPWPWPRRLKPARTDDGVG